MLQTDTRDWGGVTRLEWAGDDAYIAQADVDLNGGDWAELIFRYADPDNYCAVHINSNAVGTSGLGDVKLIEVVRGQETTVDSDTYTLPQSGSLTRRYGRSPLIAPRSSPRRRASPRQGSRSRSPAVTR
jgi:hypothetical protein